MSWQTMASVAIAAWLFVQAPALTVAAAASMTDVLPKLIEAYGEPGIKTTFDATSRLVKQLEHGAPYDVVISADEEWADKAKLTERRVIGGGHLVVVMAQDRIDHPRTLKELMPKKLALAGDNVPAGKYAEAALKAAGVWDELKPRIVRADHVRAALKWVAIGEAEAAIVYLSDIVHEPRVRLVFGVESTLHPPIRFVAGLAPASKKKDQARRFLDFLASDNARQILVSHGFSRP